MKKKNSILKALFCGTVFALCLVLVLSLASCGETDKSEGKNDGVVNESESAQTLSVPVQPETGGSEKQTEDMTATEKLTEEVNEKEISFAGGLFIELGRDADEQASVCGEANEVSEAPSCIYEGTDKVYYYDGYSFTSSPDKNGKDTVVTLEITGDEVELLNGIRVGSLMKDALEAFGSDYEESFGRYVYSGEEVEISIIADGDYVASISFSLSDF